MVVLMLVVVRGCAHARDGMSETQWFIAMTYHSSDSVSRSRKDELVVP